jgi:hypothetical protein
VVHNQRPDFVFVAIEVGHQEVEQHIFRHSLVHEALPVAEHSAKPAGAAYKEVEARKPGWRPRSPSAVG